MEMAESQDYNSDTMRDMANMQVILEDVQDMFRFVVESVGQIQRQIDLLSPLRESVAALEADVSTIKLVLSDHSSEFVELRAETKAIREIVSGHSVELAELNIRVGRIEAKIS